MLKKRKFIVVTGGVLSGLGKGIAAASIGHVLSSQYRVVPIKLDGYLNVDPGTMNPFEHGEVFVLDDGGEVDMDFGHYERFLNISCKFDWNLTTGKVFQALLDKERAGSFLGKTVQMIPHAVVARSKEPLDEKAKEKICLFSNIPQDAVFSDPNVCNVYELPIAFHQQGLHTKIAQRLHLPPLEDFSRW